MKATNSLYSFIFRGLLSEEALDRVGRKSRPLFNGEIDIKISERLGINLIDEDQVKISRKMSLVYIAISSFENSVRDFISKTLLEEKGANWWEECVPEGIKKSSDIRMKEEDKYKWQTSRGDSLINYVDFGDLVSIMQKAENWSYFEPYLSSVEWARSIMDILEKSRNVIMHSGVLGDKDIERIGMNIRDWIKQLG